MTQISLDPLQITLPLAIFLKVSVTVSYMTDRLKRYNTSSTAFGVHVMDEYHRREGTLDKRMHGQVRRITDPRRWNGGVGEVGVSRSGDVYQGCHSNQNSQVAVTSRFQVSQQQSL